MKKLRFLEKKLCVSALFRWALSIDYGILALQKTKGNTPKDKEMKKTYSVLIINEKGIYETVAKNVSGILAGAIAKRLRSQGIWVQTKEEN